MLCVCLTEYLAIIVQPKSYRAMVEGLSGIVISDVFGSAGDVTAYHRDGRVMLRRRSIGGYAASEAQLAHLEVHRRALAGWRGLSSEVQALWNEYAREVEPHRPPFDHSSCISGQNLFVSAYHGFYVLGRERCPVALRFEGFPGFGLSVVSTAEDGEDLRLGLAVAGLEMVESGRYWLYGRVQLVGIGRGESRSAARRSVLSSGAVADGRAEVVLTGWRSVWPEVAAGASVVAGTSSSSSVAGEKFSVVGSFVLLDGVSGYRSQRRKVRLDVEV